MNRCKDCGKYIWFWQDAIYTEFQYDSLSPLRRYGPIYHAICLERRNIDTGVLHVFFIKRLFKLLFEVDENAKR
jgi:hypothetical protein